jgi:dihydrodipicolinate synthase/N-acetylneuraminate lyase
MDVPDREGMIEYYRSIATAVAIPIIIQDTPTSDAVLTAELMWRLCQDLPNVRYAKVEGRRFLVKTAEMMELAGDSVQVIGGAGGRHLIHLLRLGVTAFMTGTEALDIHGNVVSAHLEGDEDRAARIYYEQLLPYLMFYQEYNRELLKGMLHLRGIIDCPKVLAPASGASSSGSSTASGSRSAGRISRDLTCRRRRCLTFVGRPAYLAAATSARRPSNTSAPESCRSARNSLM